MLDSELSKTNKTDLLKVFCPHCDKLYSVQKEVLKKTAQRFECKACEQEFWLPAIDQLSLATQGEVFGLKAPPTQNRPIVGSLPLHTPKRLTLWKDLIDHFDDEKKHESFIAFCDREGRLDFAAERYQSVLKAVGPDVLTEKYLKKVEALLELKVKESLRRESEQIRVHSRTTMTWLIGLSVFGLCLIGVGYFVLHLRNVAGLGAAILFISLAIKSYLKTA